MMGWTDRAALADIVAWLSCLPMSIPRVAWVVGQSLASLLEGNGLGVSG